MAPTASAATISRTPTQDTYVEARAPRLAHGSAKTLRLSARPLRRAFLRFDLRQVDALERATLRVYLTGRNGGRLKVGRVAFGQRWSERATTFATAPSVTSGGVRSKRAKRRGWVEVDVTGLVAAGALSDLVLSGSPSAVVGSSESSRPPRLLFETPDSPAFAPGPPVAPAITPAPGPQAAPPGQANVPPVVELSGPGTAYEGQSQTYAYTLSEPSSSVTESCGEKPPTSRVGTSFDCRFPDGPTKASVAVTANDGELSGSDSLEVTVANVPPTVTLSGPAAADEGQTMTYTYTISDPGNDANPAVTESCGDNASKTDTPAANAFQCTFAADSTVTVTAYDGDAGGSDQLQVTVANVAPKVTLSGPATADEGQTKTYTYAVSDPGDDPNPAVTESCGANATKIDTPTANAFDCAFPDGPATSTVIVTADDGALSGSDSVAVAIANVAPTVDLAGPAAADEGQTKTYTYAVSDPGDDPNPAVTESCGANATKIDTPTANAFDCAFPDGPAGSTVAVTADDGANSGSDSVAVTIANVPPTVTLSGPAAADEGQTMTYTYTISDPGNDANPAVTESCGDNASKTDTPAANAFQCTFPDGPATSTVSVTADDDDGTIDGWISAAVANVAPALTLPASQDAGSGTDRVIDLGSFEDPGPDGPWTVDIDWGDNSPHTSFQRTTTGPLGTQAHTYPDGAEYEVTISVTDKDGGMDSETLRTPDAATLTITQDAAPTSPQDFAFTLTDAEGTPTDEFVLDDDADPQHESQKTFTFRKGEYGLKAITGTHVDGWTQSDIFCEGDEDAFWDVSSQYAEVIVDPGEHIECHFQSEQDATLTVIHDSRPDSAQDFTYTVPGRPAEGFTLDDDTDPALPDRKVFTLSARRLGQWVISASEVEGWGLTDLSCTGDSEAEMVEPGTVELNIGPGETVVCTYVQTQDASVTVVQDTDPDAPQDFAFTTTGAQLSDFTLDDDAEPALPAQRTTTVSGTGFGAKTITQSAAVGWSLANITCTGDEAPTTNVGARSVTLTVDPAETIVCRFDTRRTGFVGGVYPEASNSIGPLEGGDGNLYTVTELSAPDPRPCIRKSSDGGRTWNEVDGANRPSHSDLESLWLVQDGTRIHVLMQRSGTKRVSYHTFNTSDAPANPDRWQIKNQIVHLPTLATAPDNEAVSLVQRSNGDLLAFYRTDVSGTEQRLGWREKPAGSSTWGPETIVDSTAGRSFTQVAAVRGAQDAVHIFYKNDTESAVWHKTLSADNTLSSSQVVNDSPTTIDDATMINPVYVDAAGTERVAIAWKRISDGALVGAVVENGVPQPEEKISDIPVYEDPLRTQSQQPVAALAADPAASRIHAVYSANATHDLWTDSRDSSWGVDASLLEATDAELISANVFRHSAANGGQKVVGTVFDVNTNRGLPDNEIFYTEYPAQGG